MCREHDCCHGNEIVNVERLGNARHLPQLGREDQVLISSHEDEGYAAFNHRLGTTNDLQPLRSRSSNAPSSTVVSESPIASSGLRTGPRTTAPAASIISAMLEAIRKSSSTTRILRPERESLVAIV